jgi:ABC-type multidrug transport system ATPase subunit
MDTCNSLVIETHNLSKAYKGVQALKDLHLTVKQHSIFGFPSHNGAGKTTTVRMLKGVIEPTSGLGPIAAHHVNELIERLARRKNRTVFMCTHNLLEDRRKW